jgi:hypothetical protein
MSRRPLRTALLAAAAVVALLGLAAGAQAYLTARGAGRATAAVTTLPAPTITSATPGAASVRLAWSAVTPPGAGAVSYAVTRDAGAAGGDCSRATTATSCTDTGVSLASHTYVVTATWRSWTGRSASSSVTVAYGAATQLVFTTQPGGATGGSAFTSQPVVTARDAGGNAVANYAGTVTLSILRGGAAGAVLSGCSGTLVNGVTTFSGCKVDKSSGTATYLRATDRTFTVDSNPFTVGVGAVAQLLFTTQPGNATGGGDLSTQPVVTAADAGGNTVTSYTGTVGLSIASGTGTAGAALSNCSSSRRNGVTTFDNCAIDKAGSGYRLHAQDRVDSAIAGDSAAFNVTVGSVSQLIFSTQPGGGATGGSAFPTQPVVAAADAGGNTVTTDNSTVTLTIHSGTGTSGAALSGCSGTRVGGVTTFSGCKIDRSGTGYELRATRSFVTDDSAGFNVTVGPLVQLVFSTSPSSSTQAGTAFATQPAVAGVDAGGNTVTSYAGTLALSIASGTGTAGATLSGCNGGSLRSGVTTFSGCKLDRSGSGYRLHASDGTLAADSATFAITPGSASQLAFTTQPAGAVDDTAFTTQPVVTAYDALGNVATGYSGTVTLSIVSGTGTRGASLDNCSGSRSNGVVTFSACELDRSGSGYQLRATDRGGLTATSTAFAVAPRATHLALTAVTTRPVAGATDDLTITALDDDGNVVTSYTGSHDLTFSGPGRSPSGTAPTVTNSAGSAVAFGTPTSITFVDGVARVSGGANGTMVLRSAGTASINVDDQSIDNDGDELGVTIAAGAAARLAFTSASVSGGSLSSPCLFTCTNSSASNNGTLQARVSVTDLDGNVVSNLGSGHTVRLATPTSGAGSGGSFTAPSSGSSTTLTIATTGLATSTATFTFRAASGSWTTNTFTAATLASTVYTGASATVNN